MQSVIIRVVYRKHKKQNWLAGELMMAHYHARPQWLHRMIRKVTMINLVPSLYPPPYLRFIEWF